MPGKILVSTLAGNNNTLGVPFRVFLGPTNNPALLLPTLDGAWGRCAIDPLDDDNMLVSGKTDEIQFSNDGGATWAVPGGNHLGAGSNTCRKIMFAGAAGGWHVAEGLNAAVLVSADSGATFNKVTGTLPNGFMVDGHFWSGTAGVVVVAGLPTVTDPGAVNAPITQMAGGTIARTTDSGANWTPIMDLSTFPLWAVEETPQRIDGSANGQSLVLVSSHAVYGMVFSSGVWNVTRLWDITTAVNTNFNNIQVAPFRIGWYRIAAPNLSASFHLYVELFDELHYDAVNGIIQLSGHHCLRAHSLDMVTFTFRDPGIVVNTPAADYDILMADFTSASDGFIAHNRNGAPPLLVALRTTADAGITTALWKEFDTLVSGDDSWNINHFALSPGTEVSGCTLPTACNYDPLANMDDGSCNEAVKLVNCETLAEIHTTQPSIVALACRNPRMQIDIAGIVGDATTQALQFSMDGSVMFNYSASVSTFLTAQERIDEFINGLIAYVNTNTTFRATHVPVLQNTLVPNSANGIWITCPDTSCLGLSVNIVQFGLITLLYNTAFDSGSAGSVVKVTEYPGACFLVCGAGTCNLAESLTLVAFYEDCARCVPFLPPTLCMPCESIVSVGGTFLTPSMSNQNTQCAVAGQVVRINMNIGFPDREPETFTLTTPGYACSGNCPMEFELPGDVTLDFVPGSQFTPVGLADIYTVATATYDAGSGTTTITSVENCQSGDPFDAVTNWTACPCNVRVLIRNTTTDVTVFDTTYPCVDGFVNQLLDITLPTYGTYSITITASDCGATRVCQYWLSACNEYVIENIDCHEWRLSLQRPVGAPSSTLTHVVTLTNVETGTSTEVTLTDAQFPYALPVVLQDNVYLVEVVNSAGGRFTTELVDICAVNKCVKRLTLDLFCTCDDPCSSDCTTAPDRERKRYEVARLSLVLNELNNAIFSYRSRWLGIWTYSSERLLNLGEIANLVRTLREISVRCGMCEGTIKPLNPCQDCS